MKVIKTENYAEMSKVAAEIMAEQVNARPDGVLGLATGSTPVGLYQNLIAKYKAGELDFSRLRTVNLDEYYGLDGDNDQSYRYFMNDNLFNHVNIDKANTNVPNGKAADATAEGARYDALIEELGGIDIQLLGIGLDGHIGFNEPDDVFVAPTHAVELDPSTIEANARFFKSIDDVPRSAITMGMKSIMNARRILLVANGSKKKAILEASLYGPITPKVPASILQLHPDLTVVYTESDE